MSSQYMLLRSNQESGPYTIDELLQQKVGPADLIWEIDSSYAWQYPAEVRSLRPHLDAEEFPGLSPRANTAPRHLRAKKAPDEIEIKAEKLRKRIQEQATQNHNKQVAVGRAVSEYTMDQPSAVLSDFQFVHHKPKKFDWYPIAVTAVACIFAGGFLFAARNMFMGENDKLSGTATQVIHTSQHAALAATPAAVVAPIPAVVVDTTAVIDSVKTPVATVKRKKLPSAIVRADTQMVAAPQVQAIPTEEVKKPEPVAEQVQPRQVEKEPAVVKSVEPEQKASGEDQEEKKGFLKGIFKKKNRD